LPRQSSDARKTEDRIVALTLSDNRDWSVTLDGRKLDEKETLEEFVRLIQQQDPDVLEGHNLHGFILPYISTRAEQHGIELLIARDGTALRTIGVSPEQGEGPPNVFEIAGRHCVDTLPLAQSYDFSHRSFESLKLADISTQLGLVGNSDNEIMGIRKSSPTWGENAAALVKLSKHDARMTRLLSDHLTPSSFYLSQMCPMPLGAVARSGSAAKIELLLLREYIRKKHSVPKPSQGSQSTGGYTDIFLTGVLSTIVHADVESLYPSIILSRKIAPESDKLRLFPSLLSTLVNLRLDAKKRMKQTNDTTERSKLNALQSSFKVLINSFYGYLGYSRALFNDCAKADLVTTTGQELLREIIRQVDRYNGTVIEVDTDGIYFVPPDNVLGEEQEVAFVERLSTALPEGINLAYAGRFRKMLSYKKKNYALLTFDDKISIKGSSLISRSLEPFCRAYIRRCIECLLHEDIHQLHLTYERFAKQIADHSWNAFDFARTEMFRDSIERYEAELTAGTRNPSAAYEVARKAGRYTKPGERISYYVTGTSAGVKIAENSKLAEEWDPNFPDENTQYYLGRLDECSRKFEVFFKPEDFKRIFSVDDLFGFDPSGIEILTKPVTEEEPPPQREERPEFTIWLDAE
jgi:DNA polymerase I